MSYSDFRTQQGRFSTHIGYRSTAEQLLMEPQNEIRQSSSAPLGKTNFEKIVFNNLNRSITSATSSPEKHSGAYLTNILQHRSESPDKRKFSKHFKPSLCSTQEDDILYSNRNLQSFPRASLSSSPATSSSPAFEQKNAHTSLTKLFEKKENSTGVSNHETVIEKIETLKSHISRIETNLMQIALNKKPDDSFTAFSPSLFEVLDRYSQIFKTIKSNVISAEALITKCKTIENANIVPINKTKSILKSINSAIANTSSQFNEMTKKVLRAIQPAIVAKEIEHFEQAVTFLKNKNKEIEESLNETSDVLPVIVKSSKQPDASWLPESPSGSPIMLSRQPSFEWVDEIFQMDS